MDWVLINTILEILSEISFNDRDIAKIVRMLLDATGIINN